jgi:dihydrofolate reductase
MVKASVFIAASVDGYIARTNDDLDWLPADDVEEHGYEAFMASVDALVIGRRTFEKVLTFGAWPYGEKPVFVLSTRELPPPPPGAVVEHLSGEPADILARLEGRGLRHVYVDGGITIQKFLAAGLIQRLVITRIPVLLGSGIPLFGELEADVHLKPIATRQYSSGLVQSEYVVVT